MKIEILAKNVKNEEMVRSFIQRKVDFALDRVETRIKNVVVRIEDETKTSPAFDGICKIEVDMLPRGHVHVSATGESVFDCVLQAIRKMEHAVKHDIDRRRRSSKIRHSNSKREFVESLDKNINVNMHSSQSLLNEQS